MRLAKIRSIVALAAGIPIASCMNRPVSPPTQPESAGTILFHNHGRERVQVYLVGDKENWFLGRLEPMETAHLRLPQAVSATEEMAVVLAVIPGWSRSLAPRSDRRATLSIFEFANALPGEEWLFVNGQLQGPRRRRSPGQD